MQKEHLEKLKLEKEATLTQIKELRQKLEKISQTIYDIEASDTFKNMGV